MLLYQQATLRSLGLMQPQQEAHYQDGHVEKLIKKTSRAAGRALPAQAFGKAFGVFS